jgi:hypothetical protein
VADKKRKRENLGFIRRRKIYAEYLLRRDKYPLPFDAYEVHHKDFNNSNFHTDNLQLITPKEHDRLHDEHNEALRRKAEKIEEQLDKIREINKRNEKKKKKNRVISVLIVMILAGVLIMFLSLVFKSPTSNAVSEGGGIPSLGYATIGKNYVYPADISTMEKATETCNLRCINPANSVVTNFPLHYITCYCEGVKYFVDTRTLEDISSQEIASREKTQLG